MRIPYRLVFLGECLRNVGDLRAALAFILNRRLPVPLRARLRFVYDIYRISLRVDCAHVQAEILAVTTELLSLPGTVAGCFVEAGCAKGGSTAKFSLAAKLANRTLVAFDSFEGLPDNDEQHPTTILGETPNFSRGRYCGTIDEVRGSVATYGDISRCEFVKGWFEDTMPHFKEPIALAYLDVDLAASTRTCLTYLYPLLQPGGVLFSQDGHLHLVIDVFDDDDVWERHVGCPKPHIEGLGTRKLIRLAKSPR